MFYSLCSDLSPFYSEMENVTAQTPNREESQSAGDALLTLLKNTFFNDYLPAESSGQDVIFMSTVEIYNLWQTIYPSADYTTLDVATEMHNHGFKFFEAGKMRYEWILKPATR